jgi:AraC-like DNA-binding protein
MPGSRVLTFADPFPYQAAVRAADVEIVPTARGKFYAELTQITFNQLWMQRFRQRLPQITTSKVNLARKIIGFHLNLNSPSLQYCGMDVVPGDIIVNDFDVTHQRYEGDLQYGTMSLAIDDFEAATKAITGREYLGSPLKHLIRPNRALMSRLLKLHEIVGQIAHTTPDILVLPEVVRALEQEIIHMMIRCLTEGEPAGITAGGRRHDLIIARFEEYLEAHPDTPLHLVEICAAIGVAERTLRAACREHLGMGPTRYLNLRRMHLVRRALTRADRSRATVTQVATDHGFWELGRFSVTYRALFGESPSETLRRPSSDDRTFSNRRSSLEHSVLQG